MRTAQRRFASHKLLLPLHLSSSRGLARARRRQACRPQQRRKPPGLAPHVGNRLLRLAHPLLQRLPCRQQVGRISGRRLALLQAAGLRAARTGRLTHTAAAGGGC